MSQENVEVMRAAFEAIRDHDGEAFRRLYDPEIEWEDVSGLWGDWGTRRGLSDVRDAFRNWFEAFEEDVDFKLESIADAGDQDNQFRPGSCTGQEQWSRRRPD